MSLLITYFVLALLLSFICSLLEAVLLTAPSSYASILSKTDKSAGQKLEDYKDNINRPLAAILTVNTFAHTIGAAGVGAETLKVFSGDYAVAIASGILTFFVLIFSEIIPKTIGSTYWRNLLAFSTKIISLMIVLTYPFVRIAEFISDFGNSEASVTREEVIAMAEMGEDEGVLEEQETDIIENTLTLKDRKVKDVMTPRSVMFALEKNLTVGQVLADHKSLDFSRIPIYDTELDNIVGQVNRYHIMSRKADDQFSTRLYEICSEVSFVNELEAIDDVLELFLENRDHLSVVKNKGGQVTGIITLEDTLETLLGKEIVDEHDSVVDMRDYAEQQKEIG